MKKRIAIFAAGWGAEILEQYVNGVQEICSTALVDVYLFLCFPLLMDSKDDIEGELNIFNLCDLTQFDGAMIFGNSLDFGDVFDRLNERCAKAGIPTVSTGRIPNYGHFLCADNYQGAKSLCEHLKEEHNVKRVFYIAGSDNNPDSMVRHQVIKEVFEDTLDEDVFFSNWDIAATGVFVEDFVKSGKKLPDAFVCANDGLAIFTIDALTKQGVKVPEDVLVTGFDDTFNASVFSPSMTTVSQNFFELGVESANTILNLADNQSVPLKQNIPCILKKRNSCGCDDNGEGAELRAQVCHDLFINGLKRSNFTNMLNRLDSIVLSASEFNDLYSIFREFYTHYTETERGNLHIVIEPDYENSVYFDDIKLPVEGYSDTMYDVFSMNNYQMSFDPNFKTKDLVPHLEAYEGEAHTYIFMPIHSGKDSIGYFIMPDATRFLNNDNSLIFYQQRLINIFGKFRKNLLTNYLNNKLSILNETDSLTQVKNRQAYESKIAAINKLMTEHKDLKFAFAMFDINNLKKINDEFGHELGDEYIINCCKFLCNIFKRSPVYRVGGDEFLVILMDEDFERREELMEVFKMQMDIIKDTRLPLVEQISIASGMSSYDSEYDYSCASIFKRADDLMYEEKQRMKRNL